MKTTIEYRVECLPETEPIEGNVSCSGSDKQDALAEQQVREKLQHTQWAWCTVHVTATWCGLEGHDWLGGCSYESEEDFMSGDYYKDMRHEAAGQIREQLWTICDEVGCKVDLAEIVRIFGGEK